MRFQRHFAYLKKSSDLYQRYCQKVIDRWGLNATSFHTIMFFANNPRYNTARDLCYMWGLKTGIASVAIDQLIRAGLLTRETDPNDRRVQRLYLTPEADELVRQGREVQNQYRALLSTALTPEEVEEYSRLTDKIMDRMEALEREM